MIDDFHSKWVDPASASALVKAAQLEVSRHEQREIIATRWILFEA